MRKLLLLLTLLLSISTYVAAQNYTEVVYLKNGSVIKGVIIEQVPNVSLKIKTGDGSLIICQMNDVEKIIKEERYTRDYRTDIDNRKAARNTLKGYKGFVDFGYIVDLSDYDANKVEISTSHGYQFNNYFYLGGGVAADFYTDADLIAVPIFVDFRANFINKKVTPFADIKTGYSVGDVEGAYVSTGIGVRFSLKGKKAINLKLEYNYQQHNDHGDYSYNNNYYSYDYDYDLEGLGFKVGFEF
ncbi:DUF481 domain-containing protein [Bacteroides faecium]|uniref:Outer membrane protein beta-barrel domain-containing protein n=1 Tax=Bacteroides faecium TaxID=2715212 RepID=A0A6H0KPP6_9BACE|nr:DUF481 domain-containing protein [Bacteroides faecium]QIU94357.1 hypothetical protein BacF7301_09445 [Bacteroides faecium]